MYINDAHVCDCFLPAYINDAHVVNETDWSAHLCLLVLSLLAIQFL